MKHTFLQVMADFNPSLYIADANSMKGPSFEVSRYAEDAWEFTFKGNTAGPKKIKLNWCQLSDLNVFFKILPQVDSSWKTSETEKLYEIKDEL